MPRIILCIALFIATTAATAQTPIPRQGDSCPTGTYRSGDYCKPFKSTRVAIVAPRASISLGTTARLLGAVISRSSPGSLGQSALPAGISLADIVYGNEIDFR
jgi:hypothetical protein